MKVIHQPNYFATFFDQNEETNDGSSLLYRIKRGGPESDPWGTSTLFYSSLQK